MNTRFTKIKFDGQKVRVEYEVLKDGSSDPDEYSVFSADQPKARASPCAACPSATPTRT